MAAREILAWLAGLDSLLIISADVLILVNVPIRITRRFVSVPPYGNCYCWQHSQMPNVEQVASTQWINTRRSQRVLLRFPVVVRVVENQGTSAETTHTLVVNAHGALIAMTTKVQLKQELVIENTATGQQQPCRVVHIYETQDANVNEIGIEFEEPLTKFWNIAFPPAVTKSRPD